MNLVKSIRTALDSDSVIVGTKKTLGEVISGNPKFVVVASNCEKSARQDLLRYSKISGVEIQEFDGSSIELGEVCGKPFVVSMLAVMESGMPESASKRKN